jgi:hypothetical protein
VLPFATMVIDVNNRQRLLGDLNDVGAHPGEQREAQFEFGLVPDLAAVDKIPAMHRNRRVQRDRAAGEARQRIRK